MLANIRNEFLFANLERDVIITNILVHNVTLIILIYYVSLWWLRLVVYRQHDFFNVVGNLYWSIINVYSVPLHVSITLPNPEISKRDLQILSAKTKMSTKVICLRGITWFRGEVSQTFFRFLLAVTHLIPIPLTNNLNVCVYVPHSRVFGWENFNLTTAIMWPGPVYTSP